MKRLGVSSQFNGLFILFIFTAKPFGLFGVVKVGSHDPINTENFCVRDGICWCSHDPVFASNYFVTSSKTLTILVLRISCILHGS